MNKKREFNAIGTTNIYMFASVQYQIRSTTEFFITVWTFNRFAGMQGQMGFQYRVLGESFAAKFTLEWTLSGVYTLVTL